jgi:uncharacterized membrane protein YqjE
LRIKKLLLGYILFAAISGLALAVWRTVLMLRYYDPYNNEYAIEASGALKSMGFTLFFIFVILATSAIALIGYEFKAYASSELQVSVFTSALLGFVFLAIGVFVSLYLKTILEDLTHPLYRYAQLVTYALLFFCAVYFILCAAGNPRFEQSKKLLAFVPPLWCVAFLVSSYLDPLYNYKDYNHILCNVAISALALFLLYDSKMIATGKATSTQFVFALISLVASMVYMLPTFVLLAYWELSSDLNHIFEAALLGAIFYCVSCLRNLCKTVCIREKKKPEEATEEKASAV